MRENVAQILTVLVLAGSGTVAGVMFGVARAVAPWFRTQPASQYVRALAYLDDRYDPLMPWLARLTLLATAGAAVLVPVGAPTVLFAIGGVCIVGVAIVSETVNVALNRRIRGWDPENPPPEWQAVRARWGRGNLLRTVLGLLALIAFAGAAVTT